MTLETMNDVRNTELQTLHLKIFEYAFSKMMGQLVEQIEAAGGEIVGGHFANVRDRSYGNEELKCVPVNYFRYVLNGYVVSVEFSDTNFALFKGGSINAEKLMEGSTSYRSKHYSTKHFVNIVIDDETKNITFDDTYDELVQLLLNPCEIRQELIPATKAMRGYLDEVKLVKPAFYVR